MSKIFKHKCIKPECQNMYSTSDEDAYYCAECLEEKNRIASEVDKKFAGRVTTQVKSELDVYNELQQKNPVRKGGVSAVNAKDLGWL